MIIRSLFKAFSQSLHVTNLAWFVFCLNDPGNGHEITLTFRADACLNEASSAAENVKVIS